MMQTKRQPPFFIFLSLFIGIFLIGCKTTLVQNASAESKTESALPLNPDKADAAMFAELKTGFVGHLNLLKDKDYQKSRKLIISKAPYFKNLILAYEKTTSTPNALPPNSLKACQFIAARIELDDRIETAEWLVTTQGHGACQSNNEAIPQTYWLVMHHPRQVPRVIQSGRALAFQLWRKGKGEQLKRFETHKYNDIKDTEILCYEAYKSQGENYILRKKYTEGYIFTPLIPEKTWQPVNDPKYRCRP